MFQDCWHSLACHGLYLCQQMLCTTIVKSHNVGYKRITTVSRQSFSWRDAGCAGFCSSPALTHLIQLIKPNELIILCIIAGLEQKCAHQVDQGGEQGWSPLVWTFLFTQNDALVIIAFLLRCLRFTNKLHYLYIWKLFLDSFNVDSLKLSV